MRILPLENLLCFAEELGFFPIHHPKSSTTTEGAGPANAARQHHRVSAAHVAAAPGGYGMCCPVCLAAPKADYISMKLW